MDMLLDLTVNDEYLSHCFENFIIKNEIEIQKQSELNICLLNYIMDEKTDDNMKVLDYVAQNYENSDKKMLKALKNSFKAVFKINKILKNAYHATSLSDEAEYELIPLVKMTNLRGIGLYDYIKARIIELDGVFYLLEVLDCFGEFREHIADVEAIKCLIKYPESQTLYNSKKRDELNKTTKLFHKKFIENVKSDELITTNKLADIFIEEFNALAENRLDTLDISKFKDCKFTPGYFEIKENEEDFIKNALGGFSSSLKDYDIGFFADESSGLYVIPFLGTFNEILRLGEECGIENAKECIKHIILSDSVSANMLIKKSKEFKNFIPLVNKVFNKNFSDVREIISFFKPDFIGKERYSPAMVLYNSKVFEKVTGAKVKI